MVLICFTWVYIFCLSCGLGVILYNLLINIYKWKRSQPPLYLLSLAGLCFLIGYLAIYSLFAPINLTTHLSLLLLVLPYFFTHFSIYKELLQKYLNHSIIYYSVWSMLILIYILDLLFLNTLSIRNDDSAYYYIQAIKWSQSYPVIPGVANVIHPIGYNSSFFLWSAFFNGGFIFKQSIYALNSYLTLLLAGTSIGFLLKDILNKNRMIICSIILTAVFCLLFDLLSKWISAPTPDITAMVLLSFVFIPLLYQTESQKDSSNQFETFILILLIFTCVTIKLSVLPILGVLLYLVYSGQITINKQSVLLISLSFLFIIGPWLIRNVITTGYLIYPFPYIDIFSVDWKIPLSIVINEKNMIHSFAMEGANDWQRVFQIPFWQWLRSWFSYQSILYKILLTGAAASPLLILILFYKRRLSNQNKNFIFLWLITYLGFIFWLNMAPQIRFGAIFIYLSFLIPMLLILKYYLVKFKTFVLAGLLIILLVFGLNKLRDPVHFVRYQPALIKLRLIYPEHHPTPQVQKVQVTNGTIWQPITERVCWDAPIPCGFHIVKRLEFRGSSITDGFRIKNK